MAWTTPKTWSVGNSLPRTDLNTYVRDNSSYLYTKLDETTLALAAASITFSNIPAAYRHLWIVGQARGDAAITAVALEVRFNSDSGNNYDYVYNNADGVTVQVTGAAATSIIFAGEITAATATASYPGGFSFWVQNYAGTTAYKTLTSQSIVSFGSGTAALLRAGGVWKNTAAITSVTLLANTGNLAAGSMATLYGMLA